MNSTTELAPGAKGLASYSSPNLTISSYWQRGAQDAEGGGGSPGPPRHLSEVALFSRKGAGHTGLIKGSGWAPTVSRAFPECSLTRHGF